MPTQSLRIQKNTQTFFIQIKSNRITKKRHSGCFFGGCLNTAAPSLSINLKFYFCGVHAASFVFPLTCAAEKHIISEKPLNKRFFKGTGVVLAGIECSPKIFDFRASGIPVQERVDFFDTLGVSEIRNALTALP